MHTHSLNKMTLRQLRNYNSEDLNELYFRKSENNSAEIRIEDKDERLVLYFHPKNEKKKRNIEIHQAHCMCSALRNVYPLYTPLQTQNEVQIVNQTNENTVYIDVV